MNLILYSVYNFFKINRIYITLSLLKTLLDIDLILLLNSEHGIIYMDSCIRAVFPYLYELKNLKFLIEIKNGKSI